jgi:integration host factor subunit alpha
MNTLTKIDLTEKLYDSFGLNKTEAKELVDCFFEEIRAILEKGEEVKLSGFGNFIVRSKKERPGRNPRTGQEYAICSRRVVTFKSGQKLRSQILQTSTTTEE